MGADADIVIFDATSGVKPMRSMATLISRPTGIPYVIVGGAIGGS